jgi:hypothetical protein
MTAQSIETVEKVLDTTSQKTFQDILDATELPPRTARYALRELRRADKLIEKVNFRDMRKTWYALKTVPEVNPCDFLFVKCGEARCSALHPDSQICRRETPNKFKVGNECLMTGG